MDDRSFDSLTRHAAGGVSRRGSLITLGAAGLAAALSAPFAVEAKKKHGRKKKRQQSPPPPDRCTPQVEPCTAFMTSVCGGAAACPNQIACCSHFGSCDSSGFFACLILAQA